MSMLQPELLAHLAQAFPDAVAWRNLNDGDDLTLGRWHLESNRLARGLQGRGVSPGDRVALAITEDRPLDWLISYMAIHKAGAVAVPLNTRLSGPEISAILGHAGAKGLLVSPAVLLAHPDVRSGIELIAVVGPDGADGPDGTEQTWNDLFDPDAADLDHRVRADDVADVMYTSGTTGAAKGVVVRHGGLSSSDRVPTAWHGLGFISSSPFSTTSGSLLICGPMRGGLSGWFLPRFDPGRWLRLVASERPIASFLVPAMVQLLVADPQFESADLSSLVIVNIGSAPIAGETLRRFGAKLPAADIMNGYGMTEFGAVTATPMGDGGQHIGSVGRPLPGVELRIVDPADREVPVGQVGQVTVRGTRPARSYLGDPAGSADAWSGGWLHSGDLGYLDPDGFLWVVGRQKEIIIRGGHNIGPGEVEAVLFEHPDVADAAVAGIAHPVLGEDIAAWIVVRPGTAPSTAAIREFLLARLADYKVPRRITLVDALPRNEAGKVLKSQLVADDVERNGA